MADVAGRPALARRHLEACVFSCLARELKSGDLSVEGSDEYADYREQLLSWEESAPLVEIDRGRKSAASSSFGDKPDRGDKPNRDVRDTLVHQRRQEDKATSESRLRSL